MEIWDLFNEDREPFNRVHERGQNLSSGEFHIDVEIWTVNSNKDVLLTLRDPQKENYPNKWEATGGSALSGETSTQAAIRELSEETGIIAEENELSFLGTCKEGSALVDVYLLRSDIQLSELTMQEGETVDAKWVSLEKLDDMVEDESIALPIGEHFKTIKESFQNQLENL